MSTITAQVLEVIATHPEDTITVKEIMKQLPDGMNLTTVRTMVSKTFKNMGVIKKVGKDGLQMKYRIMKREVKMPQSKYHRAKKTDSKGEMNLAQIGQAIVMNINNLHQKIRDLSAAYSNLQSEYNKELAAHKMDIKERDKKNTELLHDISILKEANKRLNEKVEGMSRTFKLNELMGQ